jgi:hypothetical protein
MMPYYQKMKKILFRNNNKFRLMKNIYPHLQKSIYPGLCRIRMLPLIFLLTILSVGVEAQTTIWTDNFDASVAEPFTGSIPGDWVCSGTGDAWTYNDEIGYCDYGTALSSNDPLGTAGDYSANADIYMTKSGLNFSAYSQVEYRFSFTGETEYLSDYLYFEYFDGTWHADATFSGYYADSWYYTVGILPTTTTAVRFHFTSDGSDNYIGMFIEDINITPLYWTSTALASKFDYWMPSDDCGTYARYTSSSQSMRCTAEGARFKKNIDNSLMRTISLAGYGSGLVDFRVWNQTEPSGDYIYLDYYSGSSWTNVWSQSGDYSGSGWQTISGVPIPAAATQIRFRFTSDNNQQFEGVYIDDVVLRALPSCTYPVSQANTLTYTPACNQMTVGWTRGTGDNVIVLAREGSPVDADPLDGNTYTANASYGSGTEIGVGNYVVYNSSGSSVLVTNLNASTTYYFNVYEYYNAGPCYRTPALTGSNSTSLSPAVVTQPSNQTISGGGNATFTVTATGAATYQWQEYNLSTWSNITDGGTNPTYAGSTTSTLTLTSVPSSYNNYKYRCYMTGACTPDATTDENATISIGSCTAPGIPGGITGTSAGTTTANLLWTASTGSPALTYYWVVGTTSSCTYGGGGGAVDWGTTTGLNAVSTILTCGTTYWLRVYAVTSCNGTSSAYGTSASFTTTACPAAKSYRTNAAGPNNWTVIAAWQQTSTNCGTVWGAAAAAPLSTSCSANIRNGHTINIAAALSCPPTTIDVGGILNVSGNTLTIPANVTLINRGTINVSASRTIIITGTLINYGTINNSGTVTVNGTLQNFGNYNENYITRTNAAAARIFNYSGAAITIGAAGELDIITASSSCTNYGTITNNTASYYLSVRNATTLNNYGTLNANGLTIVGYTANGGVINNYANATINVGASGRLQMGNGATAQGTLNNYGIINNNATTSSTSYGIILAYGALNNNSGATITNGSSSNYRPYLYVNTGYTLTNAGTINNYGGIYNGSIYGRFYVYGTVTNASGGIINNNGDATGIQIGYIYYTGTINNNAGATFNNNLNGYVEVKTFNNNGTYNEGGCNFIDGGALISLNWSGSTFNNNAGATYTMLPMGANGGNYVQVGYWTSNPGTFNNAGTFTINKDEDGYLALAIDSNGVFNNTNTVTNNTGQIRTDIYGGGLIKTSNIWNENARTLIIETGHFNLTAGTMTISSTGSFSTGTTFLNNGTITNSGTISMGLGSFMSGSGAYTSNNNSWVILDGATASTEFISSGTGTGNFRIPLANRTFNNGTSYSLSSSIAMTALGGGFNTTMKNLDVSIPLGLSISSGLNITGYFTLYSGNLTTNNNSISVGTDFSDGGMLTLGAGSLSFTNSGRYFSNPTNVLEDFNFSSNNCDPYFFGWPRTTVSGTDVNWIITDKGPRSFFREVRLPPSNTDKWFFSPSIELTAGRTYTFSIWYRDSITSASHANFTVYYGTAQSSASMTTTVLGPVTCTSPNYMMATATIIPASSGRFYLGIKGTTPAGQGLYVDDIYLSTIGIEEPLTNFTVNSAGSVMLATQAVVDPSKGPLTLTNGAFSTGTNLKFNNGSTIIRSGGILADMPTFATSAAVNVTYNAPSPAAVIIPRAELPTSASVGYLNNLYINNSSGVTLGRTPLSPEVLYSQDFETGATPSGWASSVITDGGTVGAPTLSYESICTFASGSVTPEAYSSGNYMVQFNATTCDEGDQIQLYQTSPVDVTGYNNIRVNFDWYRQTDNLSTEEGVYVLWSSNGSTWNTNVFFCNFEYASTTGWQTKTVLLPKEAENISTLYIGLLFQSQEMQACLLDNLTMTGQQYNGAGCNVTVNGGGGTGVLTLNSGFLSLNSDTLTINNSSASAITGSGYIVSETYDNGSSTSASTPTNTCTSRVQWNVGAGTGTYVVPFGTAAGVDIPFTCDISSGGSAGGSLTASTYHTSAENWPYPEFPTPVTTMAGGDPWVSDNSAKVIDRFWSVSYSGYAKTYPTATLRFEYDPSELPGGLLASDALAQYWDFGTSVWSTNLYGSSAGASYVDGIILQNLSTAWTLVDKNNPLTLPVEFASFTAKCNNDKVELKWSTASETNNDYFTIERSSNSADWDPFMNVSGAGNSNTLLYYTAEDNEPLDGISYYRLKQTDFDGAFTYSDVATTSCGDDQGFELIAVKPGQQEHEIVVSFTAVEGETYYFNLFDNKGQLIKNISDKAVAGYNEIHVVVNDFSEGIYMLTLQNSNKYFGQKILLK